MLNSNSIADFSLFKEKNKIQKVIYFMNLDKNLNFDYLKIKSHIKDTKNFK